MSWTRCEREGKDGILAAITELVDAGVPVPSVLAIADLRFLRWLEQEGVERVPPHRDLAKRWGWGPKRAFLLMQNETRWADPEGGVYGRKQGSNEGATREQEGSSEGAGREQAAPVQAAESECEGAGREQRGSRKGAAREQRGTRARSLLDTSTSTSTSTSTNNETAPAPPSLVLVPPEAPPQEPTAPTWAAKVPQKGTTSTDYAAHVCRALAAIRGRDVDPARCATDAKEVIGLWTALERPPIATLADDLVLVARWAQQSQDPMAARSLRAEGWAEGTDRSRSVQTLCRRDAWGDRVEAARRWAARTTAEPRQAAPPPPEPKAPDPPPPPRRTYRLPQPIPPSRNHHLDLLK